jgi:Na+-transporting NADH:ubiquinone oxidoreductase subunit A
MTHIQVTKGLDIPIKGKPAGAIQSLHSGSRTAALPTELALNLNPIEEIKFKVLVKVEEKVKLGQPLAEDKEFPGRFFVSPAGGTIKEIRRGLKRRLLDIIVEVDKKEEVEQHLPLNVSQATREETLERLKTGGLFAHIRQRPFNTLANPDKTPRSIFVKALESAPFTPPSELQVSGYEKEFQAGLNALAKMTSGKVHLIYRQGTSSQAFLEAKNVEKHTAEGPHPVANLSLSIHLIDPITSPEDVIWTLNVHDVVAIGYLLLHGRYFVDRVIGIAGPGVKEDQIGFFKVREGYPIASLVSGRLVDEPTRLISGDVLTGTKVEEEDFLGFYDYCISVVPENLSRQFLHFLRLGVNRYTFSGTYLSSHLPAANYEFTTSQHGEHRPFIDASLYDKVMPLKIPTMHLVKAILAEDYDLAAELGLLEVDSEDFALPTFVCPSKVEMTHIVKQGLRRYAADVLK